MLEQAAYMVNKMDEAFNVGATYEEDDDDEKDGS